MAWKSILIVVTNPDRAAASVAAAGAVAAAHDAHLHILAVGCDPSQAAYAFVTAGTVVQQAIFDRAREDAVATAAAASAQCLVAPDGRRGVRIQTGCAAGFTR